MLMNVQLVQTVTPMLLALTQMDPTYVPAFTHILEMERNVQVKEQECRAVWMCIGKIACIL